MEEDETSYHATTPPAPVEVKAGHGRATLPTASLHTESTQRGDRQYYQAYNQAVYRHGAYRRASIGAGLSRSHIQRDRTEIGLEAELLAELGKLREANPSPSHLARELMMIETMTQCSQTDYDLDMRRRGTTPL